MPRSSAIIIAGSVMLLAASHLLASGVGLVVNRVEGLPVIMGCVAFTVLGYCLIWRGISRSE